MDLLFYTLFTSPNLRIIIISISIFLEYFSNIFQINSITGQEILNHEDQELDFFISNGIGIFFMQFIY